MSRPDEIGWIAGNARDRFLVIDDVLLPLYKQFAHLHVFEKVIVFPFSGAPVPEEFVDYEALLGASDHDGFEYAEHDETDAVAMCYTSGTTDRPKGVVYPHRSTILHPDDLLDLMQLEPPTLSLGVPTIWLGLIQAFERAQTEFA